MKNSRMYPVEKEFFDKYINPIIIQAFSPAGRPQKVNNYQVFSAVLYLLRTGISWRDMPREFGYWHTIYLRFQKWSERNVIWQILRVLQTQQRLNFDIVMIDSTTFKVHRHGGGLKGGFKPKEKAKQE